MSMPRASRRTFTTIGITSGKGGVGKTSVAVNLAAALARLRHRVALLDADFALGNVDVLLGLAPEAHLGHVLAGERALKDIVVPAGHDLRIIPATSGLRHMSALTPVQWRRLADGLDTLNGDIDFLIVDTAAGISDNVVEVLRAAERVVIVTSLEPTAVVDAYAMIKLLTLSEPSLELAVLVNSARDEREARLVFSQLDVAADRFLGRRLAFDGFIPHDTTMRDAILAQRPVVDHMPQADASRAFRVLASRLAGGVSRRAGLSLVSRAAALDGAPAAGRPQCA
jgi:flagellar biosynthesis protein FlhG